MSAKIDDKLLQRGIRFNAVLLGLVLGAGCGVGLFLVTHLSLALTGENAGRYLNLLGVFLPGYSVSSGGAWIGLFWGFVLAAISGGFVYLIYARSVGRDFASNMSMALETDQPIRQFTLRISGHALGIGLGLLMSLSLFTWTIWLVIRGTADNSPHAALLRNYLPSYTVDFGGALIGAIILFIYTYILCRILAGVYNTIVIAKHRKRAT